MPIKTKIGGRVTKYKGHVVSLAPFVGAIATAALLGGGTSALAQAVNYDGSFMPEADKIGEAYLGPLQHTQDAPADNQYFEVDTSGGQYIYHENPSGVRQVGYDEWVAIVPNDVDGRSAYSVPGKMIGRLADSMTLIGGASANLTGTFNLEQRPPPITAGDAQFAAPFDGQYFKNVTSLPTEHVAKTQADGVIKFYAYSTLTPGMSNMSYFKGQYAHGYLYRSYADSVEFYAHEGAKVYVDYSNYKSSKLEVMYDGHAYFDRSYALRGKFQNLGGTLDMTRNVLEGGGVLTRAQSKTYLGKNKFKAVELQNAQGSVTTIEDLETENSSFLNGADSSDKGSQLLLTRVKGAGDTVTNNLGNTLSFTDVVLAESTITNFGTATAKEKFDISASAAGKGSTIANDGTFTFTDTLIDLSGTGAAVSGAGAMILNGTTLNASAATFAQGKDATAGVFETGLILKKGSTANFGNAVVVDSNVDLQGGATLNLFNQAGVDLQKSIGGSVKNAGVVNMATGVTSSKLSIGGDYTSAGGKILLDAHLTGDSASSQSTIIAIGGNSYNIAPDKVNVNLVDPVAASGAEVVQVITIAGATNEALFTLDKRVESGAYEYFLKKEGDGHWYLISDEPTVPPIDPPDPIDPTEPVDPTDPPIDPPTPIDPPIDPPGPVDPPVDPSVPPKPPKPPTTPILRPEIGAYGANIRSAATMFDMKWHDRKGAERQANADDHRYWARGFATDGDYQTDGQMKIDHKTATLMLGADLAVWEDDKEGEFTFGVFGGYGNGSSTTFNHRSKNSANASIDGITAGVYLDWRENRITERGAYVDTWLRYGDFDAKVSGVGYDMQTVTASGEIGYTYDVAENNGRMIWFEPQAQIIYSDIDVDTIRDAGRLPITSGGVHGLARLGMRAGMDVAEDRALGEKFYVQLDYLEQFKKPTLAVSQFATEVGGSGYAQMGFGYEAKINDSFTGEAGFTYLTDFDDANDYGINLALHMKF